MLPFFAGLGLIALTLAVETVVLMAFAWIVLSAVRYVPLVGRRHRPSRWEPGSVPADRGSKG